MVVDVAGALAQAPDAVGEDDGHFAVAGLAGDQQGAFGLILAAMGEVVEGGAEVGGGIGNGGGCGFVGGGEEDFGAVLDAVVGQVSLAGRRGEEEAGSSADEVTALQPRRKLKGTSVQVDLEAQRAKACFSFVQVKRRRCGL